MICVYIHVYIYIIFTYIAYTVRMLCGTYAEPMRNVRIAPKIPPVGAPVAATGVPMAAVGVLGAAVGAPVAPAAATSAPTAAAGALTESDICRCYAE